MREQFRRDKIHFANQYAREQNEKLAAEKARIASEKIRAILGMKPGNRFERNSNHDRSG